MCVHKWENLQYPLSLPSKQTLMSNPPMSHQSTTETALRALPSSSLRPRLPPMMRACCGQDKTVTQTQRKHLPIIFRSTNHPKMDHSLHINTKTPTTPSPNWPSSKLLQLQPPSRSWTPARTWHSHQINTQIPLMRGPIQSCQSQRQMGKWCLLNQPHKTCSNPSTIHASPTWSACRIRLPNNALHSADLYLWVVYSFPSYHSGYLRLAGCIVELLPSGNCS